MKDPGDVKHILCTSKAIYRVVGTLKLSHAKSITIAMEKFNMLDEKPKIPPLRIQLRLPNKLSPKKE